MATLNVFFPSCSKDEEDGRGGAAATIDGKRLVEQNTNGKETVSYEYNASGQISVISFNEGKIKYQDSISYDYDKIIMKSSRYSSYLGEYIISDGRILNSIIQWSTSVLKYDCKEEYEYNEDGYLKSIHSNISTKEEIDNYTNKYTKADKTTLFTWKDGNLVQEKTFGTQKNETWKIVGYNNYKGDYLPVSQGDIYEYEFENIATYTYTEYPNVLPIFSSGTNYILGWQGYFGKSSSNIPQKIEMSEKEVPTSYTASPSIWNYNITYDYIFVGNLVTEMKVTRPGKYTAETNTTTFMWE